MGGRQGTRQVRKTAGTGRVALDRGGNWQGRGGRATRLKCPESLTSACLTTRSAAGSPCRRRSWLCARSGGNGDPAEAVDRRRKQVSQTAAQDVTEKSLRHTCREDGILRPTWSPLSTIGGCGEKRGEREEKIHEKKRKGQTRRIVEKGEQSNVPRSAASRRRRQPHAFSLAHSTRWRGEPRDRPAAVRNLFERREILVGRRRKVIEGLLGKGGSNIWRREREHGGMACGSRREQWVGRRASGRKAKGEVNNQGEQIAANTGSITITPIRRRRSRRG